MNVCLCLRLFKSCLCIVHIAPSQITLAKAPLVNSCNLYKSIKHLGCTAGIDTAVVCMSHHFVGITLVHSDTLSNAP